MHLSYIKISAIVNSFTSPEEVFLINSNWSIISNLLKRQFGVDNKNVTANEYKTEIEEALDTIQTGSQHHHLLNSDTQKLIQKITENR